MTKKQLFLDRFREEYKKGTLYYAIATTTPNTKSKEIITYSKIDILEKIKHWEEVYNDDLVLVSNNDIKITDYIASSDIYFVDAYMRYWFEYKR